MTGVVAGVGVKAAMGMLARRAGGHALADGKAALGWLGRRTPLELLGFAAMILAVFQHFHLVHGRHALAACTTGRADDAKALQASHANEALLRGQIADTNKRIAALAATSAAQQRMATEARQKAAPRVAAAETVAQRANASARQKPPAGTPCGPSAIVQEQWK